MSIISAEQFNREKKDDQFDRQHKQYVITSFDEANNSAAAKQAQRIQAESYVNEGYIKPEGLNSDGTLMPELDRSRGNEVTYFLAESIDGNPKNMGSVRIIDIPKNGSIDDFAAYRYSKATLDPSIESYLMQAAELGKVREVAALSKTGDADSIVSFELIREILQRAIRGQTEESWLITFTEKANDAIIDNFSGHVMKQIGEKVAIDVGDKRTSEDLRLVPTLIVPSEVISGIVQGVSEAKNDSELRKRLRTFFFNIDGLKDSELPTEAILLRDRMAA